MNNEILTQSRLKELLHYDGENLIWRVRPAQHVKVGDFAGCVNPCGYITIKVDKKSYQGHRLIWLYIHGSFPVNGIDHINGNKLNNRIQNLRDVSPKTNRKNSKISSTNTSGITGVSWSKKSGKWQSQIDVDGVKIWLGYFDCKYRAASVRHLAMEIEGGYTKRHGV